MIAVIVLLPAERIARNVHPFCCLQLAVFFGDRFISRQWRHCHVTYIHTYIQWL